MFYVFIFTLNIWNFEYLDGLNYLNDFVFSMIIVL